MRFPNSPIPVRLLEALSRSVSPAWTRGSRRWGEGSVPRRWGAGYDVRPPGGGAAPRGDLLSDPVRVFVTGGTFDKEYDELTGRLFFKNTHVDEMLRRGRCGLEVDVETLMMVDSLDMSEGQRATIVRACRECDETQIVITHGTDTMVETARAIAEGMNGKTIVLTGAMVPY